MENTTHLKEQFIDYISDQNEQYRFVCEKENHYVFDAGYANAVINFYPQDIVEFRIESVKDRETKFFLHFQLNDIQHAEQLFDEMCDVLSNLHFHRKTKILLTCTSGLTTSYFSEKLNATAKSMDLEYEFQAVDYTKLYQVGGEFDAIILAPQVAYLYPMTREVFVNKPIIKIPASIFGSYDTANAIVYVQNELRHFHRSEESEEIVQSDPLNSEWKMLVAAIVFNADSVNIGYRVYDHGRIVLDRETIKSQFSESDLHDIFDTVLSVEKDIQIAGIALPGIVNDGCVNLPKEGLDNLNLAKKFSSYYGIPCVVTNDVNAAAYGYYGSQSIYRSIVFHFQPTGHYEAGQGVVVHGKLVAGKRNIAGEVKYFLDELKFSGNKNEMIWDPEGMEEIVSKLLLVNICTIGPDAIVIQSDMTPDKERILKQLRKHIPQEYLPEIIVTRNMKEYMLLGQKMLCERQYTNMEQGGKKNVH